MKVLSIEQMTKLKELGVDVEPNGLDFMYSSVVLDEYRLMYAESVCEDDMKAFGLQEVVELLPGTITMDGKELYIIVGSNTLLDEYIVAFADFESEIDVKVHYYAKNILDAAYEMLIWVLENGYLKTKRDENN